MHITRTFVVCAAVLAAPPAVMRAQSAPEHPLSLGILAGGIFPTGFTNRFYDPTLHVGALAQIRTPAPWLGIRLDAGYQRFGGPAQSITNANGETLGRLGTANEFLSASADLVFRLPNLHSAVRPYAMAGMGLYRRQADAWAIGDLSSVLTLRDPSVFWSHGVNVGAGAETSLGRHTIVFAETRYQHMGRYVSMVPVSIGVRLR